MIYFFGIVCPTTAALGVLAAWYDKKYEAAPMGLIAGVLASQVLLFLGFAQGWIIP